MELGNITSSVAVPRTAIRRRLEMFAEGVSIVGFSYLIKPSDHAIGSIFRKAVWTMLLLFGTGFMCFQIYDHISYYQTYPTTVSYKVAYNRSLRFPTVTICSEYLFSKRAVLSLGPRFREIASTKFPPVFEIGLSGGGQLNLTVPANLDWEFLYKHTIVRMDEALIECSFDDQPCHLSGSLNTLLTDSGYCFSFNPATSKYVTTRPGAHYGLRLVLWFNQSDCLVPNSPAAGFRAVLHDEKEFPFMSSAGFRIGTGISSSISFSLRNLSMLPAPYGDCRQAQNYTYMRCMKLCAQKYMVSKCKCRALTFEVSELPVCSFDQSYRCISEAMSSWISSGASRECDCPLHCHQVTYPNSISTSALSEHFLNYMKRRPQLKGRNLTMSKLSKELVYLDIFYSQLSYIDIQTTPAYNFLTLVCDIGGALGLILGCTILTIAELIQFLLELSVDMGVHAVFARCNAVES